MLATLTDRYFSDPNWIFERKLDGERCLVLGTEDELALMSRNRGILNAQYPELVAAFESQDATDFIIDGEIVAFEGSTTSFSRLQRRMHVHQPSERLIKDTPTYFYAFDLLSLQGRSVTDHPLIERKALLKNLFRYQRPLRFTTHRRRSGEAFLNEACAKGWEGLIAKRADAPYTGGRSRSWLKFKCSHEQEFVVGGFTDPKGTRAGFGALLLGYFENKDFVYAGKVGTGFGHSTLFNLSNELVQLEIDASPFDRGATPRKDVHWVRPRLVVQIAFSEWTRGGQLRHPRFIGLRRDKKPNQVVRETPE